MKYFLLLFLTVFSKIKGIELSNNNVSTLNIIPHPTSALPVVPKTGWRMIKEINKKSKFCKQKSCVTFTVSQGTGCAWMCNYCGEKLGTNNYYFTDNVCVYKDGSGCAGNPIAGTSYTCCAI